MITSERQYRDTLAAIERFEDALAHVDEVTADLHPLARETMAGAYEGQLQLLRADVFEYEARSGQRRVAGVDGVSGS